MSAYGIECSRCGGTILPGDGHALQHERTDVAELVKAARKLEQHAREEAEWLQNEGYKRGMYLEQDCDEFLAALKHFTREA